MTDARNTWETYASSWKAVTAAEKTALYEQSLARDCIYTDPLTRRAGWDELCQYMLEFHQQVPGGYFKTVEFFAHHGRSVARWEMRAGNEAVVGTGMSYGEYNESGKLVAMTGFFALPGSE